jgi:glycosyltransferase involved in cell wall biosynthesis
MDAAPTQVHRWFIQKLYDWTIAKFILRSAEQVLFVDDEQSQKLALRKKLSPNKIVILPNGIDVEIFKPQPVTVKDFTLDDLEGKPIFLFVGNLLPVKGLEVLLKAWSKLENKDAVLLVVGGGYAEERYRKLAGQLALGNRVRWLGSCTDRKKLARYYSLATATIVPSFSESFSLVAAEAAACGSPVIGSDIHGMRARVIPNKTGILFQPKNVASLTQAIQQVLAMSETERKQCGMQGRELIENNFSLPRHVDELEKVYKHLL